jgi:hypothetical protein
MSDAKKAATGPSAGETSVPTWIATGLIGIVLGVGGTMIVSRFNAENVDVVSSPPGSPPMGGGGGPPGMGGGGGFGGGGGARNKANLSSLVGKLELLTRETLHVDLMPDQTAKIAEKLAKLDQAEKLTDDDAQTELAALEAILTPEQKATVDSIRLPAPRPAGGGGAGPGGPPMVLPGGGAGAAPPIPVPGGGGPPAPDANPFKQEANQKQLRDLLGRIQPGDPAKSETAAKDEPVKTEAAKTEAAKDEPAKTEPAKTESEKAEPK